MKRGLPLLALLLAACNGLPGLTPPPPPPFQAGLSGGSSVTAAPGASVALGVTVQFNDPQVSGVDLSVRLADPCAKGTSTCPGWDTRRYPGVTHPSGKMALSPASPTATLNFQVSPDALPQGPFKYEVVLTGQSGAGKTVETVTPFYLKILPPGQRSGMEGWNFWRSYAGLPSVKEDPEWSWGGWLHSRYMAMNYPNNLPHDEDLSQPFASTEGQQAGRKGNEWGYFYAKNGAPYWPSEESSISWWISAPFHRFNMMDPRAANGGFGVYKDVGALPGYGDGWGRSWANLPNLYGGSPGNAPLLFPVPDKSVALSEFKYGENPIPTAPCMNPDRPAQKPFLTQTSLTWDDGTGAVRTPLGFPLTLQTFPDTPLDTQVLDARLTRLSDGALNPLCAYGSQQYWEPRDSWHQRASDILRGYGAVIALPHEPLTPGASYQAYLKVQLGSAVREFIWNFSVAQSADLRPLRLDSREGWQELP